MGEAMHRSIRRPRHPFAVLGEDAAVTRTKEAGAAAIVVKWAAQVGATTGEYDQLIHGTPPDENCLSRNGARPLRAVRENRALADIAERKVVQPTDGAPTRSSWWLKHRRKAEHQSRNTDHTRRDETAN